MELRKRNIHMNKLKCRGNLQTTLDNDFNVPDVKPDIADIIKEQATISLDEVKCLDGRVTIRGNMQFSLLYVAADGDALIQDFNGSVPFEEVINMENACSDDDLEVWWEFDDLRASIINSRKINIKGIISFSLCAEQLYDEEIATNVEGTEPFYEKTEIIPITQLTLNKHDNFRIKDEWKLPSGKPNVARLLYSNIRIQGIETRVLSGQISVKGELNIFILYIADNEDKSLEFYETQVPFGGTIDCAGCDESMVGDIRVKVQSKDLVEKADEDGEERLLDWEVVLDLAIKIYSDEEVELLKDVYSTALDVEPVLGECNFENLLMKNDSKVRILDKIEVPEGKPEILQIICSDGEVRIDDKELTNEGIKVEGVLEVCILYITKDDAVPLASVKGIVPFSQTIEVRGINANSLYHMEGSLEQMGVSMVDSSEIEVRASIRLDTIAFDKICAPMICDLQIGEIDYEKMQELPGVVCYFAKEEDSLWDIAKKFYTTVENIMELNNRETEELTPGERLILVKEVGLNLG